MNNNTDQLSIINGVEITQDGNIMHFKPVEDITSDKNIKQTDNLPWYKKIYNWFTDSPITPYIKIRDLSDPFDNRKNDPFDDGSGSKNGAEIGIKISF